MTKKAECGNCKFFKIIPEEDISICRRFPPKGNIFNVQTIMNGAPHYEERLLTHFPNVGPDRWCGEHVFSILEKSATKKVKV